MNIAGIPVYCLDALAIQELLAQPKITAVKATQRSAHKSMIDKVITEFKVAEE